MEPLLADENFNEHIIAAVERRLGELDLVWAQRMGLGSTPDPTVLAVAADLERVLLTHDERTMLPVAFERVRAGQRMPGVVFVPWTLPIGVVVNDLEVIVGCGLRTDFDNQVLRVPY